MYNVHFVMYLHELLLTPQSPAHDGGDLDTGEDRGGSTRRHRMLQSQQRLEELSKSSSSPGDPATLDIYVDNKLC